MATTGYTVPLFDVCVREATPEELEAIARFARGEAGFLFVHGTLFVHPSYTSRFLELIPERAESTRVWVKEGIYNPTDVLP